MKRLLIRNGRVVDPSQSLDQGMDVLIEDVVVAAIEEQDRERQRERGAEGQEHGTDQRARSATPGEWQTDRERGREDHGEQPGVHEVSSRFAGMCQGRKGRPWPMNSREKSS